RLREVADDRYGFITTADLAELKVPAVEVRKLAARGKLNHVRRGVYRFPDTKPTERDDFAAALVSVGDDAYLVRDAVLALHGLASVNPKKIRVATARRIRHAVPTFVAVEQRPADGEVEVFEGIKRTRVAEAILDCQGLVMAERLDKALADAFGLGLVTHKEFLNVRKRLRMKAVK
ncbi:MAG: type IV toxin-antitoxin system AbiEi family antitoxin domain-containing protein, partial [Actinobacteria bacterium]|nr:type IV toxin-antitoxin system AbiEi family antitoxin domain-containing protein [Actinomycetota bacterium]